MNHKYIAHTITAFPPPSLFNSCNNDAYHVIVPQIPYAGIGYALGGVFFEELASVFGLYRLDKIKQLAFLRNPSIRENNPSVMAVDFPHTRFTHSLDVGVLMGLCVDRFLKEHPQVLIFNMMKTALCAGFLHDLLTPAGGDTMKTVSDEDFDEDAHFNELFARPSCKAFFQKHEIDESLLYDIIQNKGILGQLLNYADKIAYTSRDVYHFVYGLRIQDEEHPVSHSVGLQQVRELVSHNPSITSLWNMVTLYKGVPCFTGRNSVKKVADFKTLRALMFRHLYYHPDAQFPERACAWFVLKELYGKVISRQELLSEGDDWLKMKIDEYMDFPFFANRCLHAVFPKVREFKTEEHARAYMREVQVSKTQVCFYEHFKSRTKNGIEDFFICQKRKIGNLYDFDRARAEEIERLMIFPEVHRVYSFSIEPFSQDVQNKLLKLQVITS